MRSVENLNLHKWEQLLAKLNINLEGFWGEELIYPKKISNLHAEDLKEFAHSLGIDNFAQELFTPSEQELEEYELILKHHLPLEYKNFCRVFGEGRFSDDEFCINCQDTLDPIENLESNPSILESCLETFKYEHQWTSQLQSLVENAYLFGWGNNKLIFVFDLRTWSDSDQSYDIYGLKFSDCYCYQVGRDFFKFIQEGCIGGKINKEFPNLISPLESDGTNDLSRRSSTFTPIPDLRLQEED
jgi:hypothetical protein